MLTSLLKQNRAEQLYLHQHTLLLTQRLVDISLTQLIACASLSLSLGVDQQWVSI